MKVLHVINSNGIAGAEKHLLHLLPGLQNHGIEASLLIICPPAAEGVFRDFAKQLQYMKVRVDIISAKKFLSFSLLRKISKYIKTQHHYFIHSHLIRTDLLLVIVKRLFCTKMFIISTLHGYQESVANLYTQKRVIIKKNSFYFLSKLVLRHIDLPLTVSHSMATFFVDYKLTPKPMAVVRHGLNVPRTELPETVSLPKKDKTLIVVGRLTHIKGQHELLKSMPAVLAEYPLTKLQLVGEGPDKEKLQQQAFNLGIEDHIEFLGFQKDPFQFIKAADVVIIPSLHESFGLVYIEAMALQKAIISFDIPIATEILQHKKSALVVPKGDTELLAKSITNILSSSLLGTSLGQAAATDYRRFFTEEVMVDDMAKLYKQAAQGLHHLPVSF